MVKISTNLSYNHTLLALLDTTSPESEIIPGTGLINSESIELSISLLNDDSDFKEYVIEYIVNDEFAQWEVYGIFTESIVLFTGEDGKEYRFRSLARDIARKLGTVGFAYEIIRTEDNIFKVENSTSLKNILRLNVIDLHKKLMPIECVLNQTKTIILEKKYSEMLKNGMMLDLKLVNDKISSENKLILVKSGKKLVCIANLEKEYIIPRRNFNL